MSESNEIPERKKPLRNPKKPSLQKKAKFTSEIDLWNFDEDAEPLKLETSHFESKQKSHLPQIQPSITEEQPPHVEDPIPVEDEVDDVSSIRAEIDTPIISSKTRFTPNKKEAPVPAQEAPTSESNDLWADLDAQDDQEHEMEQDAVTAEDVAAEVVTKLSIIDESPTLAKPAPISRPAEKSIIEDQTSKFVAEVIPVTEQLVPSQTVIKRSENKPSEEMDESSAPAEAEDLALDVSPQKSSENTKKPSFFSTFTMMEKIASFLFGLLFLVAAGAAVFWFTNNVREKEDPYAMPDFPVKGSHVAVENIESYWREPIKVGANADPVQLKVISIPEVRIRLVKNSSLVGALRVKFIDGDGKTIGDTMTKSVNSGTFQTDLEARFACTAGFSKTEEIDTYRATTGKPWRVEVYEAPKADASPQEYQLLFSAPLSKTQK